MDRRTFLTLAGGALSAPLAGCTGIDSLSSTGPPESVDTPSSMQFQYDARNTGVAATDAPRSRDVRWKTRVSPIDGGLSVANGRVVVAQDGSVVALDADTGDELWEIEIGLHTRGQPAIADDTVYVGANNGMGAWEQGLVAIDLEEGSERWRALSSTHVTSPPIRVDETLFITGHEELPGESEDVIAIDARTREALWRFEVGDNVRSPAVADGVVYVGDGESGTGYALDADTGDELWNFETDGELMGAPTVVDDTVYFTSHIGLLHALDSTDGTERWTFEIDHEDRARAGVTNRASVAATDESVYFPTKRKLYVLDADGEERWSVDVSDGEFAPTVAGDYLVLADRRRAYCLDASQGDVHWRLEPEDRTISDMGFVGVNCEPVVAGGIAYVASHGGDVYALQ